MDKIQVQTSIIHDDMIEIIELGGDVRVIPVEEAIDIYDRDKVFELMSELGGTS